ncbi:hypothetical protein Amn_pd00540 (plasmid) [Aminobacter sp. Y103A]|uniref:hypothetical protein n=1 Tax=Aminobacter sp. Y103A TaxID=1870862 RepID=UPI0025728F12|nr:hypothetical protein [Aminobacter sp. SS-2016]BBD41501.1 hypothetical protein Amn_pd00540 [Aminobacter sp. SS-2016]
MLGSQIATAPEFLHRRHEAVIAMTQIGPMPHLCGEATIDLINFFVQLGDLALGELAKVESAHSLYQLGQTFRFD